MGLLNLTESERLEILNLHNNAKIIKEQAAPASTAAPTDDKSKIMAVQTALNTKYGTSLKVDGILGPNTLTALITALKAPAASTTAAPAASTTAAPAASTTAAPAASTTATPAAPTTAAPTTAAPTNTTPAAPTNTTPAAPTNTTPAAPTNTTPAASTTATPQSNRDQRRARKDLRIDNRRAMQDLRGQQRAQ
jgi:hypothetical protein